MNALEMQARVLRILQPELVGSPGSRLNGRRKLAEQLPKRTSRA
ncbi:MAG: hypothetical protein ABSC38_04695 [Verrucomicrobiia bacterium]